jgi:hypothetical protein
VQSKVKLRYYKLEALIPVGAIETNILLIRGHKVMIGRDLAELYGLETRALNEAVERNRDRFTDDFMLQFTKEESDSLRSQFVTLKRGEHSKYLPCAFTEQGGAMLSSVLNSERAVNISTETMHSSKTRGQ